MRGTILSYKAQKKSPKNCYSFLIQDFLACSHNLLWVYMECDYTCLNHNSLVSQKNSGHQGCDYKGGLLYFEHVFVLWGFQVSTPTPEDRDVSTSAGWLLEMTSITGSSQHGSVMYIL